MAKSNSQQFILDGGLISAVASSSLSKVKLAIDFGANVNAKEAECGWTALHFASYLSGNEKSAEKICKNLLGAKASVDAQAKDGASPLLTAASVGSRAVLDMLLAAGADVNLADHTGMTPLMGAADRGDEYMVEALLRSGANPRAKDRRGLAALDLAAKKGLHQIVSLIEAFELEFEVSSPRANFKLM